MSPVNSHYQNIKPLSLFNRECQLFPLNQLDCMLLELRERCASKNNRGEPIVKEHNVSYVLVVSSSIQQATV